MVEPFDNDGTAKRVEELTQTIALSTRLKEETATELSCLNMRYTALLEEKLLHPESGPTPEKLYELREQRSNVTVKLAKIEGQLDTAEQVLSTILQYKNPRVSQHAVNPGVAQRDVRMPSRPVDERAMVEGGVEGRSEVDFARAQHSVSPATTTSSLSIQSGFGKVSLSPEPTAMLGAIGGSGVERAQPSSLNNYNSPTMRSPNVDHQRFGANAVQGYTYTSETAAPQDMWNPPTQASPVTPSIIVHQSSQGIASTPDGTQFNSVAAASPYVNPMHGFSEPNYDAFPSRVQAGPLHRGTGMLPPPYADPNPMYGSNRPLMRPNFALNRYPTEHEGASHYPPHSPGSPFTGMRADPGPTPLVQYGVPATHTPNQQPLRSIPPSSVIESGQPPFTIMNHESLIPGTSPDPSLAPLADRPDQNRLPMPVLNHPAPRKAGDGLHSAVGVTDLSSTTQDGGDIDDAESRSMKPPETKKVGNAGGSRRHKMEVDGGGSATASSDPSRAQQDVASPLIPKDEIEEIITGFIMDYLSNRQPVIQDSFRKVTRENDCICAYAVRISRRLSLHILSTNVGNIQCLFHGKNYENRKNKKGTNDKPPKPKKKKVGYDGEWQVTGETGDLRAMAGEGKKAGEGLASCGCPLDYVLMHFILQKTWKVRYQDSETGQWFEEGLKGELWKLRTRNFIIEAWNKAVGLDLDDYFMGEETFLRKINQGMTIPEIVEEFDEELEWKKVLKLVKRYAGRQPSGHLKAHQVFTLVDAAAGEHMAKDIRSAYAQNPYLYSHEWDMTQKYLWIGGPAVEVTMDDNRI